MIAQVDMKEMIVNPALRAPLIIAMMMMLGKAFNKDTYRKIRKTEFIYICGSKNGSSSSSTVHR